MEDCKSRLSIGGRILINFRFADEIVVTAVEEEETGEIVMDSTCTG